MRTLAASVHELKGCSLGEIQRMINSKRDEIMSNLKENLASMQIIQEDQASLRYRLDHLA